MVIQKVAVLGVSVAKEQEDRCKVQTSSLGLLDRVLAKSKRLLSERGYSNDVGRYHNHGNHVQSARGVVNG
jgi:hypothetical protein